MRLLEVDSTDDLRLVTINEGIDQYWNRPAEDLIPVAADGSCVHYAILSHRWLADEEEVIYDDIVSRKDVSFKQGWKKLQWLRRQALADGYAYVWADTCCIDKSSSQELSESINSMYRWYQNAQCCYVYLHDMPDLRSIGGDLFEDIDWTTFKHCEWFSRGWTLQEMIAAPELRFYSCSWKPLQRLYDIALEVSEITGVPSELLSKTRPISSYSIAQKFSWAARRRTSRIEDRSYALLGILDVNIGIIYGEGNRAFQRLQEELLRTSMDDSIFVFDYKPSGTLETSSNALLALTLDQFAKSSHIAADLKREVISGRQCQVLSKQVTFRNYRLGQTRDDNNKPLNLAILGCWDEEDLSKSIALVLSPTGQATFGVALLHRSRIKRLDAYNPGYNTCVQTFNVERTTSREGEHADRSSDFLVCRISTSGITADEIQFGDFSVKYRDTTDYLDWQVDNRTLILHPFGFVHGFLSFELLDTEPSTMPYHLDHHSLHQSHSAKFRLHVKFLGEARPLFGSSEKWRWEFYDAWLSLPRWTTLVLASRAYQCSMKWHQGGLLVARFFRPPNADDYLRYHHCLLEIERMDLLRTFCHVGLTILLGLPSSIIHFCHTPYTMITLVVIATFIIPIIDTL